MRIQLRWNRYCEQSEPIWVGQGTLPRERDRHVAALLVMTNWVRVSPEAGLTKRRTYVPFDVAGQNMITIVNRISGETTQCPRISYKSSCRGLTQGQ